MALGNQMLRSLVIVACLRGMMSATEVSLRGSLADQEGVARRLTEFQSCGADGISVDVKPPWENMKAYVTGASSTDQCERCAAYLETQGALMSGWQCSKNWWRSVYLSRPGDLTLTERKPLQSFKIADVQAAGPLVPATDPLPANLRGVFWLSDQKTQSALITFAPNGQADGPWCSHGDLILNRYLIRVSGDRVWTFATEESAGYDLAQGLRLVYDFSFDSATNPTHATIYPIPALLGSMGERLSKQTWLLNFDMTLLSSEEATARGYPGSVVWERKSYVFGFEQTSSRYNVVQVVDENGNRIEEAWKKFVAYQNSSVAGDAPGTLFYHGPTPDE